MMQGKKKKAQQFADSTYTLRIPLRSATGQFNCCGPKQQLNCCGPKQQLIG